jgi:hypothetical protein
VLRPRGNGIYPQGACLRSRVARSFHRISSTQDGAARATWNTLTSSQHARGGRQVQIDRRFAFPGLMAEYELLLPGMV